MPVLIDGVRHLCQPGTIFEQFQNIRRRKKLDAVSCWISQRLEQARGNEDRHIMRLATEHPRRLLHGQPRRGLPNQPQELLLLFFHTTLLLPKPKPAIASFNRQSPRLIQYRGHLQGALALGPGGRALARPPPRPPAKESIVTLTRATVAFAFYRCHPMADCRHCFYPTVGDMPLLGRNSYHARRHRGGLIANTTLPGTAQTVGDCPS